MPYGTDLTTINPTCTVSSGASVLPASGANAGFTESTKTVTYTVTSGGSHTDYAATVTVEPASAACDMLTFKSGNYSGGIGGTNVTLMVPLGTNVTALSPTYTVSPGATEDVSYPSGSTRDFTTPQSYTITAQDGTTTKTYTVSVLNVPITVPRGLNPGDQYRLVFVTSTQTYSGGSNHDEPALVHQRCRLQWLRHSGGHGGSRTQRPAPPPGRPSSRRPILAFDARDQYRHRSRRQRRHRGAHL